MFPAGFSSTGSALRFPFAEDLSKLGVSGEEYCVLASLVAEFAATGPAAEAIDRGEDCG